MRKQIRGADFCSFFFKSLDLCNRIDKNIYQRKRSHTGSVLKKTFFVIRSAIGLFRHVFNLKGKRKQKGKRKADSFVLVLFCAAFHTFSSVLLLVLNTFSGYCVKSKTTCYTVIWFSFSLSSACYQLSRMYSHASLLRIPNR